MRLLCPRIAAVPALLRPSSCTPLCLDSSGRQPRARHRLGSKRTGPAVACPAGRLLVREGRRHLMRWVGSLHGRMAAQVRGRANVPFSAHRIASPLTPRHAAPRRAAPRRAAPARPGPAPALLFSQLGRRVIMIMCGHYDHGWRQLI